MPDSKIRSRRKAPLRKFTLPLTDGRSRPPQKFVSQMRLGIPASQDVKRSNLAGSLQEEVALIQTEKRLSRNLPAAEREGPRRERRAARGSRRVEANPVRCLDRSEVRKE